MPTNYEIPAQQGCTAIRDGVTAIGEYSTTGFVGYMCVPRVVDLDHGVFRQDLALYWRAYLIESGAPRMTEERPNLNPLARPTWHFYHMGGAICCKERSWLYLATNHTQKS